RMLSTINTESKRLARMINDYLDIARVESGTQKARFSTLEIDSLLDYTLLILEPLAKRRKIKLSRAFMSDTPVILGDTEMIGRAITNIVANAIKYSPERTVITIKTQGEKDFFIISVRDNGYGISADHLPHIFEKFYRISHRDVPDISGTGLGLSMAREIIELHGGQIRVESEPNIGSTFTISLPQNVSQ